MHLRWLGTYVETSHDDHEDVVGQGEIDIVHDQSLVVTETRIGADIGLWRGFGVSVVLPVKVVSTSIRYLDESGAEVELVEPGIHHRNETVSGLGDPMLLGSYGRMVGAWRLAGRAGFSIPIGRTEEDPFELGDAGMAHQHIQLGNGTVNPTISVEASRSVGKWRLGGFLLTQQVLYENGRGYQAGDRYAGAFSASRGLGSWTLRGGLEAQGETAERWGGIVHTDDGNRGRFDAIVSAGASWQATRALTVDLGLKVPVVTHVVGGQLDMPAILELGVSWAFGRKREEAHHHDEHDHEHEHGHDEHGHDEHGHDEHVEHDRAVEPVLGKITIVDYWATWCEPCKILSPALDALASDSVVVLKVDVSDDDEWTIPLPYVEVFDVEGHEVLERSSDGDLQELIDAVKAIIAPPVVIEEPVAEEPEPEPEPKATKPKRKKYAIRITDAGFTPADLKVKAGKPVRLVLKREVEKTCATEIIMVVDGKRIERALPLGKTVTIDLTFEQRGVVTYACAMDMFGGTITVE